MWIIGLINLFSPTLMSPTRLSTQGPVSAGLCGGLGQRDEIAGGAGRGGTVRKGLNSAGGRFVNAQVRS